MARPLICLAFGVDFKTVKNIFYVFIYDLCKGAASGLNRTMPKDLA
jgi:hypothetical protein